MSLPATSNKKPEMQWLEIPKRKQGYEDLHTAWKMSNPVTAETLEGLAGSSSSNTPVCRSSPSSTSSSTSQSNLASSIESTQDFARRASAAGTVEQHAPFSIHGRPFATMSYCPVVDNSHLAVLVDDEPISAEDTELLHGIETDNQGDEPEGALDILNSNADSNIRAMFFSGVPPSELVRQYGADRRRFGSRWSLDSSVAESDEDEVAENLAQEEQAQVIQQHIQVPEQRVAPRLSNSLSAIGRPSRRILAAEAAAEADERSYVQAFRAILELNLSERCRLG